MKSNAVLSKSSSNDEIKAYFLEVSRLSKSNEEFPVDLDDVWPLVYKRKDNKKAQNMEKKNKMKEFNTLNKVGYVYSDLKKMLLKENILYFICVLVIPLPYLIFMAREFILMNSTMLFFYSGLFIYYVVTLLICLLLNYCVGKVQLGGQ